MGQDWDARARKNARFFIAVDDAESLEQFDGSGERHLELMLRDIPWNATWQALEIGCGIGRLLKPLSQRIAKVHGVDISQEMLHQAQENLTSQANVQLTHSQTDLQAFQADLFDFVYSYRVFQHISERAAIDRYIHESARVLKPGGWFRFQVCTSEDVGRRATNAGTWFGVRFHEDEIPALVESAGFTLLSVAPEEGAQSQALWDNRIVTCRRM